jgi:type I restriction enzyme S subunit
VDESKYDRDFFVHAVNSILDAMIREAHGGVGLRHITKGKLEALDIPHASLAEQRRIVARIQECLSRVEEIERLQTKVAADAKAVESAFLKETEASTHGGAVSLEDVLEQTRNGRSPEAKRNNHNCLVLTLTAVQNVILNPSNQKGIELDDGEQEIYRISKGEVYISRANTIDLVGLSSYVASTQHEVITFPDLLIRLTPKRNKILPEYLALALRFPGSRRQIQDRAIGSSRSMVKISGGRLKEVKIPLPPLKQQSAIFEKYLRFSEAAKELGDSTKGSFSPLRNAILRQAFAGEI